MSEAFDLEKEISKLYLTHFNEEFDLSSSIEELHRGIIALVRRGQDEAYERAAELCRRKYPCGDPGHDDRWCARCSAIEDGANMLEEEILALKSTHGEKK